MYTQVECSKGVRASTTWPRGALLQGSAAVLLVLAGVPRLPTRAHAPTRLQHFARSRTGRLVAVVALVCALACGGSAAVVHVWLEGQHGSSSGLWSHCQRSHAHGGHSGAAVAWHCQSFASHGCGLLLARSRYTTCMLSKYYEY